MSLLCAEYYAGRWKMGDPLNNESVLFVVRFNAILHYGPSFNFFPEEIYQLKLAEWLHRFHLVHWLISCPLIHYNKSTNRLSSSSSTWANLSHVTREVFWYSYEGELNWVHLRHLFPLNPLHFSSSSLPPPFFSPFNMAFSSISSQESHTPLLRFFPASISLFLCCTYPCFISYSPLIPPLFLLGKILSIASFQPLSPLLVMGQNIAVNTNSYRYTNLLP